MKGVRLLAYAPLGIVICFGALGACGSNGRPGSLVSGGGRSGQAGHSGQGGGAGDAGQSASSGSSGESDDGAAGDVGMPTTPFAIFPGELEVDVGCGQMQADATVLALQNGGAQPLIVSSANADSDYVVTGAPLTIPSGGVGNLLVTAPAPKPNAMLGETSSGTLSFVTNEPGLPTHRLTLTTKLLGGRLEFLDKNGAPLNPALLELSYSSVGACPDSATYRVHNTGNVAFRLIGPAFPAHLGGTATGENGMSVAPDGYAEFRVGALSAPDAACNANGMLSFTIDGAFCGAVPALTVTWPVGVGSNCACVAPTE